MRKLAPAGSVTLSLALALAAQNAVSAQESPAPAPAPAPAEEAPAEDQPEDVILVIADSLRGQVQGPDAPILELNAADIAAYGSGSITELLDALAPQTGSGRGRGGGGPAILVNGARISNFREIAQYPTEAIEKVEVLPEEVALRYGFSADQRVVNFILKRNFSSRDLQLTYAQPWDGGSSTQQVQLGILQLAGQNRLSFGGRYNQTSPLTEADRGVIQTPGTIPGVPGDPDPAEYRTLIADSSGFQLDGSYTARLGDSGTSLGVNAQFQRSDNLRLQGLDSVQLTDALGNSVLRTLGGDDPLTYITRSNTYSVGGSLNATLGNWQFISTLDASHVDSESRIERRLDTSALRAAALAGTLAITGPIPDQADAGEDLAISRNDSASSKNTLSGQPILLPSGYVSVTFDGGYDWTQIRSRDTRNAALPISLIRGNLNGGINVGIPLTSTREGFLDAIGDLNLNVNAGIDHLSDFGDLYDWTVGLTWSPAENLTFQASRIGRDVAPSLAQLGNPTITNFNVPVFDLSRNETVLASTVSGGNPNLPAQKQNDWKFGVQWQLPEFTSIIQRANISVEYFENHSENITSGFPVLTPVIEAAFPGRVTRDSTGRLVSIDQRAITLASQDVRRVQVGLNVNGPLGKAFTPEQQARAQAANPNVMQQAMRAMTGQGGAPGAATVGPSGPALAQGAPGQGAPGQAGQQGAPGQGGFGGAGGQFNPQVFIDLRTKFCGEGNESKVPTADDLAGLPPPILERMKKADGTIDPAAWGEMRGRLCSAQFGQGGPGGPGGFGGGNFNPEGFMRIRQELCRDRNADTLPTEEQLAALPEQLTSRLRKPDGTIDAELWKTFRERVCSAGPPPGQGGQQQGQGGQQQGQDGQQQGQQGQTFVFQGPPPGGQGGPPAGGGGGGFRGGGFGGGGPGGGSGDGRGRWFFNLNLQHDISNKVLVAPGGPLLDLINGDALQGGGQTKYGANLTGGLFYRGFGSFYNVRYTGESRINGSGLPGGTDLFFGDYTTFTFRVFADLNQQFGLIEKAPFLKNTRITLGIDNVFDTRQRIVDSTGTVPLRYQPFLVDAVGRRVQLELRKQF